MRKDRLNESTQPRRKSEGAFRAVGEKKERSSVRPSFRAVRVSDALFVGAIGRQILGEEVQDRHTDAENDAE